MGLVGCRCVGGCGKAAPAGLALASSSPAPREQSSGPKNLSALCHKGLQQPVLWLGCWVMLWGGLSALWAHLVALVIHRTAGMCWWTGFPAGFPALEAADDGN